MLETCDCCGEVYPVLMVHFTGQQFLCCRCFFDDLVTQRELARGLTAPTLPQHPVHSLEPNNRGA